MKKRTLNQTWILCLRMWKWIKKVWNTEGYEGVSIIALKHMWLKDNGFDESYIKNDCFFCDYTVVDVHTIENCTKCPGRLVDDHFDCCGAEYYYSEKPAEFHKELLRLNQIRKAKK